MILTRKSFRIESEPATLLSYYDVFTVKRRLSRERPTRLLPPAPLVSIAFVPTECHLAYEVQC
jgi:hypothetical protein